MKISLPRRRLIPRWRPISQTLRTNEIAAVRGTPSPPLIFNQDLFDESVTAWRNNPTAGHLGDIVAFSGDSGLNPKIADLVREAQGKGWPVSAAQHSLFSDLEEDGSGATFSGTPSVFQSRVATLRRQLLIAPENVMALLDIAQLQLAAGKFRAAKRYLDTALQLAPNGRIVLRTAARFLVHQGEYERAHALITRHPSARQDPWLIASEISLSDAAGRPSAFLNIGRRILKEQYLHPASLAELAGAISNKELFAGNIRVAREHFRRALLHPTDNVVAQAVIDAGSMNIELHEPNILKAVQNSPEAQLFQAWMRFDESAAESHAVNWHIEEPFSSRPLQFLSTLHALQGEYAKALDWVKRGLIADPNDEGLLRNLAFHQAATGDLDSARITIRRIQSDLSSPNDPYLLATQGLIALRNCDLDLGRSLYREAEQSFNKTGKHELGALCVLHYAKFAAEAGATNAYQLMQEAEEKVRNHPTIDGLLLLSKVLKESAPSPQDESQQRRLSQWIFDPAANTLTQRRGVTAKGAPSVIMKPKDRRTTPRSD